MMSKGKRILIVEDDHDIRDLMVLHLKREGLDVVSTEQGEEALNLLARAGADGFDLLILDWMLPGISGLEICRHVKRATPVLMVTARAETRDIVLGLESGADDYLTKPFEIPVLIARVRALLRRSELNRQGEAAILQVGQVRIDTDSHEVFCGGEPLALTLSEFKLLLGLARNRGRVLSRDRLIELVQGEGISVTDRAIDTHVFGLRKKLGTCGDLIETIRGVGYRVSAQ